MSSKDNYLKRTTVFFRKNDRLDEELYEMLTISTTERNIGKKLKELASEYLRTTQPELYQQAVENLNNGQTDEIKPVEESKQIKNKKTR